MDDRQTAKRIDGNLYRVFRCFGREFPVYYQYSSEDGQSIPNYPDFTASPQYTSDGRPFALVTQKGCEHAVADTPGEEFGGECGSCGYFRQEACFSVFGICMSDARRRFP